MSEKGPVERTDSMTWLKNGLSVAAVALVLAAAFLIRYEQAESSAFTTITLYSSYFFLLLGSAWFSYRHHVNMWVLYATLVALVVVEYFVFPFVAIVPAIASNVVLGGIYGISVSLLGGILFFSKQTAIRPILFIGALIAVLVFPLLATPLNLGEAFFQQILFFLALIVFLAFLVLEKQSRQSFSSVADTLTDESGGRKSWTKIIFTQRRSSVVTLVMTIPFFFCLGIFRSYSLDIGYSMTSSNVIMFGLALVIFALFLVSQFKQSKTWFTMICFAIEGVYVLTIFFILIFSDFPPDFFGIMRAGIFIIQVWVLILLSEAATEQSLPPFYLYGALAIVYLLPHIVGDLTAYLILVFTGTPAESGLVGWALLAIIFTSTVLILLLMRNRTFEVSVKPATKVAEQSDERINILHEVYGLSERESEVVQLYAQGRSARSISEKLFISESTVRTHLKRIYTKLDVHSRQELLDKLDEPN